MGRLPTLSRKYRHKFLWLFTSTSAVIAAVCVGVYYSELQNLQQSMKVDQEQKLEQKQQFILSDFETAIADLHILAGDPDLLDALIGEGELDTDGDAEAKQVDRRDVRSLLLAFLSSRNLYRQARLLDRDGRETLRIEQRQGQIHIVPEEELQDKSNRPYFKESRSLKPGEVYVSPLNLNVEDGAIERPFVPVIRFAKPLLDRNGDLQGVLVLNYQGDRLLRRLDEHEQYISYLSNIDLDDFPSRSHLVNGTGHWLKHHEPEREWGFLLPERSGQSLPQQNSGLWEAMQRRSQGSFVSDDSTYTFLKLPIFSLVQKYNLLGRVVVNHEAAQGYNWRVLIATPKGAITEKMSPLGRELLVNWLMLSALLATGLWSWFLARQQKEQVQQDLVESQEELALQQEQADVLNQRLSSQIRDSLDSEAVISTAIAEVFNLLQGDRCSFAWVDADEEVWDVVYSAKKKHLDDFSNQSFDRAPLIRAFERCELLCVNDVNGLENREIRGVLRRYGYRSVLASRVATQFGRTGVILCGAAKVRSWSTLDIELLKGVSEQVAIALNQAELFQKSQKSELEAHDALAALKKAQTQLIRSEKMSGLGQLVAGVAHEINNPVNFIFGNVEYVTDYVNDLIQLMEEYQRHISPLPPELKEMQEELEWDFIQTDLPKVLQSMRMGAERIQAIVKSLRTFSRLDEADQKSVDIHSGLESTLMILASRLKSKGDRPAIELLKDYSEVPDIECYPGLLNQVFMNLLANAIDALDSACDDPDWTGEVPTLKIVTQWHSDSHELEVQIADNGIGMDEQTQAKLFDPFFTTKPVGKGTGLGLSISYQIIVENHSGTLACTSQQGQGATFTIRLPQKVPASVASRVPEIRTAVRV